MVDELTGLHNLRGFQLFAQHELKSARRRNTGSTVVYLDVDGLKEVDDSYGHRDGDAVLLSTAALLRHVFRECDVVGRLGGDEFAVLAADVKGDPEDFANRLKAALPAAATASPGARRLSIGVGVASSPPGATLLQVGAAAIRWATAPMKAIPRGTST